MLLLLVLLAQDKITLEHFDPEPADAVVLRAKDLDMPRVFAFSPDGKQLAIGGGGVSQCFGRKQTVEIWDIPSRKRRLEFKTEPQQVTSIEWSPDANTLLVAGGGTMVNEKSVWLHDPAKGGIRASFGGHDSIPVLAKFSPDGTRIFSCSQDGRAFLRDLATGKELRTIDTDHRALFAPWFTPDGKSVQLAVRGGTLLTFDLPDGEIRSSRGFNAGYGEFSPDGALLTLVVGKGLVEVWDPTRPTQVAQFKLSTESYPSPSASPDAKLVAVALDDALQLWEVASGKPVLTLKHAYGSGSFSPDGRLLATAFDNGDMVLWDLGVLVSGRPREPDALWNDLRSGDPAVGFRAAFALIAMGDAGVSRLAGWAFSLPSPEQGAALIAKLDDDDASVRDQARKDAGLAFRSELRRALGTKPGEQLRRTLEDVLTQMDGPTPGIPDAIRLTRMAYVLEHIGSKAALDVLVRLADFGITTGEDGRLRLAIARMKRSGRAN